VYALFKNRWHMALFVERIRKYRPSKRFFGTSETAVKTPIRTAVST
jgi:hypothetical protein